MIDALDYLRYLKALLALESRVARLSIVREEAQGDSGLFRYRLELQDGSLLEIFERFHVEAGNAVVTKYSYHWQGSDGTLLKRWDNAPHHPDVGTHPHHVHLGSGKVLAHPRFSLENLWSALNAEIQETITKD